MKINKSGKESGKTSDVSVSETPAGRPEGIEPPKITLVPGTSKLSAEDLKHFRDILLKKRQQLIGDMDHLTEGALRQSRSESSGDLSSMPIHMADIGSDNFEQEFSLGLMQNSRNLVKEIDEALERIDKGTYGICMGTGKPIAKARLKLKPWAKYSVEYLKENNPGSRANPNSAEEE
jgi:RNA polymerase-binding protein DksA